MPTLRGKTAIVIGASSGVGKATAKLLLRGRARHRRSARTGWADRRPRRGARPLDHRGRRFESGDCRSSLPDLSTPSLVLAAGIRPRMARSRSKLGDLSEPWKKWTRSRVPFRQGCTHAAAPWGALSSSLERCRDQRHRNSREAMRAPSACSGCSPATRSSKPMQRSSASVRGALAQAAHRRYQDRRRGGRPRMAIGAAARQRSS